MLVVAVVGATTAACGAGVNEDLVATSTAYPLRSPVAADSASTGVDAGAAAQHVVAGEAALIAGDWAGAERSFDRALLRDARSVAALVGRAEARLAQGDVDGARSDRDAAVALEPGQATDFRKRAALRLRFGDAVGAEADVTHAVTLDPGDAASLAGRGEALLAQAQGDQQLYDRAMADFTRALALDPVLPAALLGPALVLANRAAFGGDPADWERAAEELARLDEGSPAADPRRIALAARVHLALDRVDEVRSLLAASSGGRGGGPERALLLVVEAEIALAGGDWEAAARLAAGALEDDPLSWAARRVQIQAELGRGAFGAALAAADELIVLLPGDGRALYLRGLALAGLGRKAEARQVLTEAGSALADSPVYQARIAEAIEALEGTPDGGLIGASVDLPSAATPTPRADAERFGG